MAGQTGIVDSNVFVKTINSRFNETMAIATEASRALVAPFIGEDPADSRIQRYGFPESTPEIERWDVGDAVSEGTFKVSSWTASTVRWAKSLKWMERDRRDDRSGSVMKAADMFGDSAGRLDERVLIQILTAATNSRLLKTIPNAPDGAALVSATTGSGADRFGITGGNIETGGGIASSDAIRTDLFDACERIASFLNDEGEPINPTPRTLTVLAAQADSMEFYEAFKQNPTVDGSATPQNVIFVAGLNVTLRFSPRLATGDWWVVASDIGDRPIVRITREAPRFLPFRPENDSEARKFGFEGTQIQAEWGYGVNVPRNIVKINN